MSVSLHVAVVKCYSGVCVCVEESALSKRELGQECLANTMQRQPQHSIYFRHTYVQAS